MGSDLPSPNQESNETKPEFRKPTNEATHRKYRRHSPMVGSSDEDGSPKRDYKSRGDHKFDERRKDDRVDDRRSSRSHHGLSSDTYRYSSRGNRHDEPSKYVKHADEDDRVRVKSSSQSGREARGGTYADSRGQDRDYNWPRDRYRDEDRYSRDKSDVPAREYKKKDSSSDRAYDGRHGSKYDDIDRHGRDRDHRDHHRISRDHRSDRPNSFEDSLGRRSKWETGGVKDSEGSGRGRERSDNNDQLDKDDDGSSFASEKAAAKRPKVVSSIDADSKQDATSDSKVMREQTAVNGSDSVTNVDAAKVAALKAAELVNKNLTGTGVMSADQKKKLLWGSKKSAAVEETSNRWDSALFSDRERQEKFNKLMGVKGEVKVNSKSPSGQDAEKQKELQLDLEKQYTAGLRRRDGRTVGLGL